MPGLLDHVSKAHQLLIFTHQRTNKRANVPKAYQLFNLASHRVKDVPILQLRLPKSGPIFELFFKRIFLFLNFSIMLNICKFQEYLRNCRKFILRNIKFKFWHLQNFIKEKNLINLKPLTSFSMEQPENKGTIIRLVLNGAVHNFYLLTLKTVCKKAYLEKHLSCPPYKSCWKSIYHV